MQQEKRNQKRNQPLLREFTVEVTYHICPTRHTYTETCVARTPYEAKTIARMKLERDYWDRYIFESAKVLP